MPSRFSIVDLAGGWHVKGPEGAGPGVTAREELITAFSSLAGPPTAERGKTVTLKVDRDAAPGPSGYRWQVDETGVEIVGHDERGLLHGVFAFLEDAGWSWPGAGDQWERVPEEPTLEVRRDIADAPAFPHRALVIGHHAFLEDGADWIRWAACNRLDTIFVHTAPDGLYLGAAPQSDWSAKREALLPLIRRYAMRLELGGHGLSHLMPRERFADDPDLFRMKGGARTPDHNLCVSNPHALRMIADAAVAHFAAFPEADVYHLWPDDLAEGGWCECDECKALTPSDQALIATNSIADRLAEMKPGARIAFLAYHDTEDAPAIVPRGNVSLLWAPRMRCYGHRFDDPECPVNGPRYREALDRQVALFHEHGADGIAAFEYYTDAVLFKSVLPPLVDVMAGDMKAYRAAGVDTVQTLMVGDRRWAAPPLNAWLFARLAWNPEADTDALLREFTKILFGAANLHLAAHYRDLEQAFAITLALEPAPLRLGTGGGLARLIADPPADMGDPAHLHAEGLERKAAAYRVLAELMGRAEEHLSMGERRARKKAVAAARAELALSLRWLTFDRQRLALYRSAAAKDGDTQARLAEARAAYDAVIAWAEEHIAETVYRDNFRFLHWLFWKLRLDRIECDLTEDAQERDTLEQAMHNEALAAFATAAGLYGEHDQGGAGSQ